MDKPKVTPKDFFLWAGAMVALYISVVSYMTLLFSYIDFVFPDALDSYYDPYSSGMRFAMAAVIVLFPLYVFLMYLIRGDIEKNGLKNELWVRRWALVLTIFVAGFTIAGDLITLVNYFLGGDLSIRFMLKVVIVLLVAGGALLHFLADIWGFWVKNRKQALMVGWGAVALIIVTIGAGFLIMGTPGQVRLYRFDDQKIGDLQNMQYQIVNYWQQKQKLPAVAGDLNDALGGYTLPLDPQTRASYGYSVLAPLTFKLCATFNAETQPYSQYAKRGRVPGSPVAAPTKPMMPGATGQDLEAEPWVHGLGETCFTRTIDPQRYPPFAKPTKPESLQ